MINHTAEVPTPRGVVRDHAAAQDRPAELGGFHLKMAPGLGGALQLDASRNGRDREASQHPDISADLLRILGPPYPLPLLAATPFSVNDAVQFRLYSRTDLGSLARRRCGEGVHALAGQPCGPNRMDNICQFSRPPG